VDSCVTGRVRVDYQRGAGQAGQIEYEIDVVNLGSSAIPANQIEIRYYFSRENAATAITGYTVVNQLQNPFSALGGGTVTSSVLPTGSSAAGADHYARVTFAGTTGIAQDQLLRVRTYYQPANQTQTNDYSYGATTAKATWDRIVVFVNGVHEWGCLP
jgi:hypothetical protein